mmetsp:Transcript_13212/g.19437  ORF Transcript_13212/g.19437 Transcript_13212/m.19437 type:complete len:416 (-) Transcript_13212:446-1693(-)|eukprot:CAMPEP_0194224674 /NCGR_PEP_ID=MMETSP0156-20130528/37991_1 /TAXON_ID=33649 /ORGANISM="Thalassionema nitzschioides, Strain L26-B" /LENGTH=415 /DNA_ID=CAMNT_0038956349 /DNA_START=69 /DNA_END=1316 /DNA_ORIENTATION=-
MVSFGATPAFTPGNSSNTSNAPAPAFGSSAPAPAFGASSTSNLFGSAPAPAPSGGFFGSTSAPAPSGGFFGSTTAPAPAPSGGLFGSTSAPAPSGGLFGKPSSGHLFGNSAPAPLFGTSTPAPPPFGSPAPAPGLIGFGGSTPAPTAAAIPAQAAMQAHMDAEARQEIAKLQSSLGQLHHAYAGTSQDKPSPLVTIVYNNMTSEQLQWQFANQQSVGASGYSIPPKPPQVSEEMWLEAVVKNPDRTTLIPVALVGAEALQARVGWQQQLATKYEQESSKTLKSALDELQRRQVRVKQNLQELQQMHTSIRSRMLRIMNKTEIVRCLNLPLQADEITLAKRFHSICEQLGQFEQGMLALSKNQNEIKAPKQLDLATEQKSHLAQLFAEHRKYLVSLSEEVHKEKRDIHLLKERLTR